jgi:hypothetical protein
VEQSGEIAVERVERGSLRGEGSAQARLAVGVFPDLGRGPRRERVAAGIESTGRRWRSLVAGLGAIMTTARARSIAAPSSVRSKRWSAVRPRR